MLYLSSALQVIKRSPLVTLQVTILKNFSHGNRENRSSHQRCSVRKGALRNFAKFTRKHLCQSLFFNKVAGLNFNKKEILT